MSYESKLKRVRELEAAIVKLERQAAIHQTEISTVHTMAKQEGRQSIIDAILPVLPKSTLSSQSVAYRILAKDVKKVLEEYQTKGTAKKT